MFTKPHINCTIAPLLDTPLPDIIDIFGMSEPVSSVSHLAGASVFAVLSVYLLKHGNGSRPRIVGLGVFAGSAIVLLSVSGILHSLRPGGDLRGIMLRLDYAAIFLLIAGTYTPILIILFKGLDRWGFLSLIWALALTGIFFKTFYFDEIPPWLTLTLYVGLGWLAIYPGYVLARQHSVSFMWPLVLGGIAYTLGGVMNLMRTPNLVPGILGPHEIWHLAVLAGLGWHWYFVNQVASGEAVPHELIEPGQAKQPAVVTDTVG